MVLAYIWTFFRTIPFASIILVTFAVLLQQWPITTFLKGFVFKGLCRFSSINVCRFWTISVLLAEYIETSNTGFSV